MNSKIKKAVMIMLALATVFSLSIVPATSSAAVGHGGFHGGMGHGFHGGFGRGFGGFGLGYGGLGAAALLNNAFISPLGWGGAFPGYGLGVGYPGYGLGWGGAFPGYGLGVGYPGYGLGWGGAFPGYGLAGAAALDRAFISPAEALGASTLGWGGAFPGYGNNMWGRSYVGAPMANPYLGSSVVMPSSQTFSTQMMPAQQQQPDQTTQTNQTTTQ